MRKHDQAARIHHVGDVGEADEDDGGQVVDKHNEEVLQMSQTQTGTFPLDLRLVSDAHPF